MTMINRHNYEEFFLLYADNELNAQQRAAVELFVQQNADMAEELETFMQMKLQPEEDIIFPDKQGLYKTTDVEININNYGEFFLLYIDRELSTKDRDKVEKFVLQHPQLQDEFTLLKQTVLQPEAIVFTGKNSLYRQEESKRVIPLFSFTRAAVAAAVIGIAVLGWWLYPAGTHPAGPEVVSAGKKQTTPTPQVQTPVVTPQVQQTVQQANEQTAAVNKAPKQGAPLQQVQQPKVSTAPIPAINNGNNVNTFTQNSPDKFKDNAVKVTPADAVTLPNNSTQVAAQVSQKRPTILNVDSLRNTELVNTDLMQGGPDKTTVASVTVPYKIIDTDDENRSMYIGSLELNKDKVKGFFKRVFGSKAKKDTDGADR